MAFYYHEELDHLDEAYPEAYLREMARHGFNGLWLRGILRNLVQSTDFPEFGHDAERLRDSLRRLVRRGEKYGVKNLSVFH